MTRVVLDANVFVSALLKPGSPPDMIMRHIREAELLLLMSASIHKEIVHVLTYPKISKRLNASPDDLSQFMEKLYAVAVMTPETLILPPLSTDPDDTKYLVCAVEGRADYIISGDHHLTDLEYFQGIRIIKPSDYLNMIRSNL